MAQYTRTKNLVFLAFSAVLYCTVPAVTAVAAPAVSRHELSVVLRPDSGILAGSDRLTILRDGASRITLSLAKGATVLRLTAAGRPCPPGSFLFRDGSLEFPVPEEARGDAIEVTVSYEAAFRDPVPENPVNTEDPGYGVIGTISARGTFLSSEAGWYPDIPGSAAIFRLKVEAPKGTESVTSGKLLRRKTVEGTSTSEWETVRPLEGVSLSAGPYRIHEKIVGGIPILSFLFPENDSLSGRFIEASARYLDLFTAQFGPYPFEKFAVAENFFPTGYGFPSYTLLGGAILRLPFILETSLGHEIAHSWWGNGVLVDAGGGNWSEGLVTYMADHLFKELSSPAEGREYRLKLLRDYATLVPPPLDFPLRKFTGRNSPASRAVGYGKAAMVFHMARKEAGDAAFRQALRTVAREKMGKTASWEDFDRALRPDRSADRASFFDQWVDRAGAPVLRLAEVAAAREGVRWKVTGRIVQENPFYRLAVPLRLETGDGAADVSVRMEKGDARFEILSVSPPARLVLDPDVDLFRRLDPSEIPPTVNGVRGSTGLLVIAAKGLPAGILDATRLLLEALGKEGAAIVREEDASPPDLAGRDVLYLGLPSGAGFLPAFPRELSAAPGRFAIDGSAYSSSSDALFAVLPHPADKGKVAALFLPFSAEAASQAARKIPHYGTYSYLVFSGGTNKAKGTWTAGPSPTVHEFPRH